MSEDDQCVATELRHLADHSPQGVYLTRRQHDRSLLDGVVFVRRGLYQDGVFRFTVQLPAQYNADGAAPKAVFATKVFSPLVDPATGSMNIVAGLGAWKKDEHTLFTIVTAVKKVFFMSTFDGVSPASILDQAALKLFNADKAAYIKKIEDCVKHSIDQVSAPTPSGCLLAFSESVDNHVLLKDHLHGEVDHHAYDEADNTYG